MRRFLFTGGGTLGSLTPLLAVAERLRERVPGSLCTFVVGPDANETTMVGAAGFSAITLRTGKLRRYLSFRTFSDVLWTFVAFFVSLSILRKNAPDAVMTAGSYVSVPVVWAARLSRIPVLVHQQDLRPGLANRLMLPCASALTVAFASTVRRLSRRRMVRVTGNPIRYALMRGDGEAARRRYGFPTDTPVLLVLGGSTGAGALNALLVEAKDRIMPHASILHVVGKRGTAVTEPGYVAVPFLREELADALALACVVVTRAGLATLSELAVVRKPTIIVPMPDSHQEENAEFFRAHQAAVVLSQRSMSAVSFAQTVNGLLDDDGERRRLSEAIGTLNPANASDALVTALVHLGTERA